MTQTGRPPQQEPGESRDEYFQRLWEFFDLDNDSGEYKPDMTELEAEGRVWRLRKEGRMPVPVKLFAALEEVREKLQKRREE